MLDVAQRLQREKLIVLATYCRKEERSQINNLNFHFKIQNKSSKRKEMVNIRAKINEIKS